VGFAIALTIAQERERKAMSKRSPFAKQKPKKGQVLCPYDGIAYSQVPGYVSGYGCPVCEAISFYHVPVSKEKAAQYPKRPTK
jgi:hypothetical protein